MYIVPLSIIDLCQWNQDRSYPGKVVPRPPRTRVASFPRQVVPKYLIPMPPRTHDQVLLPSVPGGGGGGEGGEGRMRSAPGDKRGVVGVGD